MNKVADVPTMRQLPVRSFPVAVAFLAGILASPARAEEPVELHPCAALARSGAMDESGTITRRDTPAELAAGMAQLCDRVVLGRFVSVADRHYHELLGPADEPVISTFHVSEVLWGGPVAMAAIALERGLLAVPDGEASRYLSDMEAGADWLYRHELRDEIESELTSIRDSGRPLTRDQHERLTNALTRLVEVPPRTKYELHELVNAHVWTNSRLNIHSELGAILPDEVYLLGLSDEDTMGRPPWNHFGSLHTYLFWGQEAQDIAAALRKLRE